jgi:PAS domain S-box-containing protein
MTRNRPDRSVASHGKPWRGVRAGDDINDLSSESIIVFNLAGTIAYWSLPAQALYGWSAQDAVGRKIEPLLSRPAFEPHPVAYERLRADRLWSGKLLRIRADGEEIVVKVRWTLRLDADDQPDAIIEFSCAEASEEAYDRLKASEARYRQLFERAPVALMLDDARGIADLVRDLRLAGVTDLDAYIDEYPCFLDRAIDTIAVLEANALAVELFGAREPADLLGPVRHIWKDAPDTFRRALVALYQGAVHFAEETKVRTLDGRTIDVLFSLAFSAQDEFLGASLNGMLDITARVKTEAQLRQLTADFSHAARLSTLGELAASIAHEIKQPLSAIMTNAQTSLRWLARQDTDLDKVGQLNARIAESAERAGAIIARIQDMGSKHHAAPETLDLNDIVQNCLMFIRHESNDQGVAIRTMLATDLPSVRGDKIQLQQIIVNLLVNSLQALRTIDEDQRDILLTTGADEIGGVTVSIQDNGTGIPPADLDRIFSGFFTTKVGGMGIGLTICQSIINAHGGSIMAANHPAGGAVFSFTLPAVLPAARRVSHHPPREPQPLAEL